MKGCLSNKARGRIGHKAIKGGELSLLFKVDLENLIYSFIMGELDANISYKERFYLDDKGEYAEWFLDVEENFEVSRDCKNFIQCGVEKWKENFLLVRSLVFFGSAAGGYGW